MYLSNISVHNYIIGAICYIYVLNTYDKRITCLNSSTLNHLRTLYLKTTDVGCFTSHYLKRQRCRFWYFVINFHKAMGVHFQISKRYEILTGFYLRETITHLRYIYYLYY